jgi:putative FmdB family regulatory protein
MPIYEYRCESCGDKFEKLVRRATDALETGCPSCGEKHLEQQYSTFAARCAPCRAACAAVTNRPISSPDTGDKKILFVGPQKRLPIPCPILHNRKFIGRVSDW